MSEIGAICALDGGILDPSVAQRMVAARAMRSCSEAVAWSDGPVVLVDKPLWSTPEDVGVSGPHWSPDGVIAVLGDLRLDNRDDLLSTLPNALRTCSDSALVAHAYAEWGDSALARLVGDYAFVLWDARRRRMLACRDILGMRPLYYAEQGGVLYVSGSFRMLFDALPNRPALDRGEISRYITSHGEGNLTRTLLQGVHRLEPGHVLIAADGRISSPCRFDRFGASAPPAVRTDGEWLEMFAHTLTEAVRVRLRRPAGTAASFAVSGGLDSSALACVAHQRLPAQETQNLHLHTMFFPETPSADERVYFDAVAERCARFGAVRIPSDGAWAYREYGEDDGYVLGEPEGWPLRLQGLAIFGGAAIPNLRVVQWGMAGDLMTGAYVFRERAVALSKSWYWRARRQLSLLRVAWRDRRMQPSPLTPRMEEMAARLRRDDAGLPAEASTDIADLLHPDARSPLAQHFAGALTKPVIHALRDMHTMYARHMGVDHRTPYQDRRLIELMMHFPPHLLHDGRISRVPLRRGLGDALPEIVRARRSKVTFDALNALGWRNESARIIDLLTNMRLEELGFVNSALLRDTYVQPQMHWRTSDGAIVSASLALESWMRVYGYR